MSERVFLISRTVHSVFFLVLLSLNMLAGGPFLKLVHFRALSGWESELSFDSLMFNWPVVNGIFLLVDGLAIIGVLLSFYRGSYYRLMGQVLAGVFLINLVYPWLIAGHYLTGFHFNLLLGMLLNGYAFMVLAFFKRKTGLVRPPTEAGDDGRNIPN
jgi:hypothetical protein